MNTFKSVLLWGIALWFIGYVLGFLLFAVVPPSVIGWIILPIGILITSWVAAKKIHGSSMKNYFHVAIIWTIVAILLDYFLLVKLLKPIDGYYKVDVYLYYLLTFAIPLCIGWYKTKSISTLAN